MSEDREILREIWEGRVPVCINLSADDCNMLNLPEPNYILVPRVSYFPLVIDKARKHFARFVRPELVNNEMWLDYEGTPLKWHYPVGVLFDLLTGGSSLPWPLTAHFSNFPEKELLSYSNRDSMESHFLSAVKEADALKHRGQVIMSMQKQDHKQLWIGLRNDRFDQFWTINRKLMDYDGEGGFKNIPFKVYLKYKPPIQRLQKPLGNERDDLTLQHLLSGLDIDLNGKKLLIQGIEPPLETPLQWLSEHLSHPDNFLHIVLYE